MVVILFDYDGVLIDSADVVISFFSQLHEEFGTPPCKSKEDLAQFYDTNVYEYLLTHGLEQKDLNAVLERLRTFVREHQDQFLPFDGIADALSLLARYHTLYVLSSNLSAAILDNLRKHDLAKFFQDVLGADKGKSKTEKIKRVAEKHSGETVYYVGDTAGDVFEAKKAGVIAVGVTWGYHDSARIEKAGPDIICEMPEDLLKLD